QALQQDGWTASSEWNPSLGVGLTSPASLQLSADGTQVLNAIYTLGNRLVSQAELSELRGGFEGEVGSEPGGAVRLAITGTSAATTVSLASAPPGRSGWLASYSRSRAQVAVAGGVLANGDQSSSVWLLDLRTGLWSESSPTDAQLGQVKALSWTVDGLYAIDLTGSRWKKRMRA